MGYQTVLMLTLCDLPFRISAKMVNYSYMCVYTHCDISSVTVSRGKKLLHVVKVAKTCVLYCLVGGGAEGPMREVLLYSCSYYYKCLPPLY